MAAHEEVREQRHKQTGNGDTQQVKETKQSKLFLRLAEQIQVVLARPVVKILFVNLGSVLISLKVFLADVLLFARLPLVRVWIQAFEILWLLREQRVTLNVDNIDIFEDDVQDQKAKLVEAYTT